MSTDERKSQMAEQAPAPVTVVRLRAADRAAAVRPFIGQDVEVTAQRGYSSPDTRSSHRGHAAALASVYGEPGMYALVLLTDDERVLAIKMPRLQTIARAETE